MKLPGLYAISFAMLLAGCATQSIQQATTFAKAGTDYGDAVGEFLDVYIVTRIDVNSRNALVTRAARLKSNEASVLPKTLESFDARAITAVRETGQLRQNVRLLRAYFDALNALATSNLPDEGGAALKSLGDAINDVNTVTGGDQARFSSEQLGAIEKIGKLAVKAAVGAKIREALERDRRRIAWQLTWQEVMLQALVEAVRDEYKDRLDDFRTRKIASPYQSAAADLPVTWIEDRRNWVQSKFHVEAFERAQKAAAHMRSVWEDMITGQNDIQSIRLILADLKEFTGIVRAYDEAEKKK